jgi:TonB family protein
MIQASLVIFLLLCPAFAGHGEQVERARAISELHAYQGKPVKLRKFCRDDVMKFEASGDLTCVSPGRSWTLDGIIWLKKADVSDGFLRLEGTRVYAIYKTQQQQFDYLPTAEKVVVTVPLSPGPVNEATVTAAMGHILLRTGEPYPEPGTGYWRVFTGSPDPAVANAMGSVPKVGGPIKPPKIIEAPDPQYPGPARAANYESTVVLWVVVGADGRIHDVAIKRPAGMGLDEAAIAAVLKWKFRPATKDGQPVAVQINIEVNFRCCP